MERPLSQNGQADGRGSGARRATSPRMTHSTPNPRKAPRTRSAAARSARPTRPTTRRGRELGGAPPVALVAAAAGGVAAFIAAALAQPQHGFRPSFDRRARRWIRGGWRDRAPQVARWLGG